MCDRFLKTNEITTENFECRFQEIEKSLQDAQVISIDVEFTGAPRKNFTWKLDGKNNLEPPERVYANFKEDANSFIIVQLGVTTLYFDSKANKYEATCYTFYTFPQSLSSTQKTFQVQGAAVEMLTSLDFDFNKVVHGGISYLSQIEEVKFKKELYTSATLEQASRSLSMEDERIMKDRCSVISSWECTANVGDSMELEGIDFSRKLIVYLLIKKIHARFSTLWTFRIENELDPSTPGVRIEKVSDLKRSELQSQSIKYEVYEKELIKYFVGVSRIFKLLIQMKKPIIASGALFDLMLMYHLFYQPLPENYGDFKNSVNELFPYVYDTKHIAYEVREHCLLKGIALDEDNGLAILDQYFRPGQGAKLPGGQPDIRLSDCTNDAPATIGQDSGWDSYYTGCCFLRMAHFLAKEIGNSELQLQMPLSTLLSAGIKQYMNCLHVAPATVDFIRLDGEDPKPGRPRSLLLKFVSPLRIGCEAVYDDLAHVVRDSIIIKMRGNEQARVTVNSLAAAMEIWRRCVEGGDYTFRDEAKSVAVKRTVITVSVIGFSSILLWKLYKLLG